MFCGKCGSKLNDGEKFCGKCGNAVQQEQMQYSNATPISFIQSTIKKNNIKSKKSLVVVLCSIVLALSVVLGVIFIPDWDTNVSIDNELPIEKQMGDEYISTNEEQYSNVIEDNTLSEESTSSENKSNLPQTEEKTTRKNNKKEITPSATEEPEATTRVADTETTTNKGENSSTTDSTTKNSILDGFEMVTIYPGVTATLGPVDWPDWETMSIPS